MLCVLFLELSSSALLQHDGETGASGCREPLVVPGEVLVLHEPSQDVSLEQTFLQGCVAFLTLRNETVRPKQHSLYHCWCRDVGFALGEIPRIVQPCSMLAGEQFRKSSEKPACYWNKLGAGLAGGPIIFALPVQQYLLDKRRHQVIQKVPNKAPDECRHGQTFSSLAYLWKWRKTCG